MMRGITLSCGCRVQLILSGLPKDVGSLSDVIIDGTMIQPCYDHDPKRESEIVSPDIEEIPDILLVPDSIGGRKELLEAVKKIRQVLRDEGMSRSQAQTVLAFTQRSLMLGWP